jgi:class 3 adenylate cyclase
VIADGVNIAARLQALAEPGGVCISERVYADEQAEAKRNSQVAANSC